MAPPRTTLAPVARPASLRSLGDADACAGYLRDLRDELLEPPEFALRGELRKVAGSGRGRVTRDGVALWLD